MNYLSNVVVTFIAMVVALLLVLFMTQVVSDIWTWFIVPTYHITLPKPVIVGAVLILSIIQHKGNMFDENEQQQSMNVLVTQVIALVMTWVIAMIIHQFIF